MLPRQRPTCQAGAADCGGRGADRLGAARVGGAGRVHFSLECCLAGEGGAACRRAPLWGGLTGAARCRHGQVFTGSFVSSAFLSPSRLPSSSASSALLYPPRRWDEVAARCEEAVTAFEAAGAMDQVRRGARFARAEAARAPLKAAARGEDG